MKYYDKDGKECDKEEAFAYESERFKYVKEYMGELIKIDDNISYRNRDRVKFIRVTETCFSNYMKYLTSHTLGFYKIATRSIRG